MKILILAVFLTAIGLHRCRDNSVVKNEETAVKRENRLISEYHKQVVISIGAEVYFIPKNEINWYFRQGQFYPISEAAVDDNICFFDTLGNIQYQALVISVSNSGLKVRCQDLKTAEYYITSLVVDSIKALTPSYPYKMKAYRNP